MYLLSSQVVSFVLPYKMRFARATCLTDKVETMIVCKTVLEMNIGLYVSLKASLTLHCADLSICPFFCRFALCPNVSIRPRASKVGHGC